MRHGRNPTQAKMEGLVFLGGVLSAFAALGGVLIALRAGGAHYGWGFQLQSPGVVTALAVLMFGAALNMPGLFEIGGSVQGVGSGLASGPGWWGAYFTGALAAVVAAQCTAPFMGPAVGWALTQTA